MIKLSISIVSHNQLALVENLLADIENFVDCTFLEVILTLNAGEELTIFPNNYKFPLAVIKNDKALGFGENHNQAFSTSQGEYFCVLNPDVTISCDPFPLLLNTVQDHKIGVVGPLVKDENFNIQDSYRKFPTPINILSRVIFGPKTNNLKKLNEVMCPDWIGGMFMLFRSDVYQSIGGFDTKFFLYLEDVDLCARLRLKNYDILINPNAFVIHHAQRTSHKNLKFFLWHLTSMMQYFTSGVFFKTLFLKSRK